METKIYVVNVTTIYMYENSTEILHKNVNTYKAFTTREKAIEYTKMITEYFDENKIENVIHDITIKEVELA